MTDVDSIADALENSAVMVNKEEDPEKEKMNFGDGDIDIDVVMDATWGEVCHICCVHSPAEWGYIAGGVCLISFFLYFFLFGLELLGNSAKVMGGCTAGNLFGDETNPIAGLMVGILATVLLQSSSTTTSIVVSLTGEDSAISVRQGIYMIMGANIGTSVTNTIVAMGQMGDGDQLERAFAGATVHDLFNFLSVIILLPLEVITGYLYLLTKALVKDADTEKGDKWEGPVKKLVSPLGKKVIIANKNLIKDVANDVQNCDEYYPIVCEGDVVSYKTCSPGLIACDKGSDSCPAFFDVNANLKDDQVAGGVCFFIAIFILFVCLIGLVAILQKLLLGVSTRIIYKATSVNGYLGMLIGCGITIIVQSSSITTSALTPLVGVGVLRLEQMFPLTLGANIGTTFTAIMAAMVTDGTGALQVALAHLFFNISGILIWYPLPFMRRVPLAGARQLGKGTRLWRGFPIVYIIIVFMVIPALFLGLSALFEQGSKGWTTLGVFLTIGVASGLAYTGFWCKYRDGKQTMIDCFQLRQKRIECMDTLPEDMEFLKARVSALVDHTGLPEEDAESGPMDAVGISDNSVQKQSTIDDDEASNEIQT